MPLPTLVCPDAPGLIERLHGRTLAVRVDEPEAIAGAARGVRSSDNELCCVICDALRPLADLDLRDDWDGVPIALGVPEAGRFRDLAPSIPRLRDLDLRVYLAADRPDNLVALRLLSSLGVPCCATFAGGAPDWAALTDLMTYALLASVPHAPIDPFEHIADHYEPPFATEWGATCFADPRCYLHLDEEGRVALARSELLAGVVIAEDVADIADEADLVSHPALVERAVRRLRLFEQDHPCARCPGWRVCLGTLADSLDTAPGCAAFFTEMLDVIDQRRDQRSRDREPVKWRP
ncbi:MAG: hypothetical protein HY906_01250 [Deltaproteobacteria bacterium]|nr:hypothetical protein [Deltaproteobacteria bacterium]